VQGNAVREGSRHGISITGNSAGTSVTGNSITGSGPSGLDVYRLTPGQRVFLRGNDTDGWDVTRGAAAYWRSFVPNHPALVLWAVVLGLPLLAAGRGRRQGIPMGAHPYPDVLRPASFTALQPAPSHQPVPAGAQR
jgi:hypothetical protein